MKKKPVLMLIACLALLALGALPSLAQDATPAATAAGGTFAMPEDAITTYFDGLTTGSLDTIYSASAFDEMAQNFKFDLYTDRLRAFLPASGPGPSEYPLFEQINRDNFQQRIDLQVKLFAFSLLTGGEIDMSSTTLMDLAGAQDFVKKVDPSRLSGIKLLKIGLPGQEIMNNDRYKKNAASSAAAFGADEQTERVALFSFEGKTYVLGFTLLRYGDQWKIAFASSPLANTTTLGTPTEMSEADFDDLTK